jgi:hypothetical protein
VASNQFSLTHASGKLKGRITRTHFHDLIIRSKRRQRDIRSSGGRTIVIVGSQGRRSIVVGSEGSAQALALRVQRREKLLELKLEIPEVRNPRIESRPSDQWDRSESSDHWRRRPSIGSPGGITVVGCCKLRRESGLKLEIPEVQSPGTPRWNLSRSIDQA